MKKKNRKSEGKYVCTRRKVNANAEKPHPPREEFDKTEATRNWAERNIYDVLFDQMDPDRGPCSSMRPLCRGRITWTRTLTSILPSLLCRANESGPRSSDVDPAVGEPQRRVVARPRRTELYVIIDNGSFSIHYQCTWFKEFRQTSSSFQLAQRRKH